MKFTHQEAFRSRVSGYEAALSYSRMIRYGERTISQVAAAADISASCSQYIQVDYNFAMNKDLDNSQ